MKTNQRSFRYSDEVAGVLESYPGSNLNEKFENIVLHYFWRRKELDAKIAEKKRRLDDYANTLSRMCGLFDAYGELTASMRELSSQVEDFAAHFAAVTRAIPAAATAAPQNCVTKECEADD